MRAALFVSSPDCADFVILTRLLVLGFLAKVEFVRERPFAVEAWAAVVTPLGLAHGAREELTRSCTESASGISRGEVVTNQILRLLVNVWLCCALFSKRVSSSPRSV